MHILADIADASGQGTKDVILVLIALLTLASLVVGFIRKPAATPQPFKVEKSERYATARGVETLAAEVKELSKTVSALSLMMQAKETDLHKHLNNELANIHRRLDPVLLKLEHMLGEWETFQKTQNA